MTQVKSKYGVSLKLAIVLLTAAVAGSAPAKPRGRPRNDDGVARRFRGVVEGVEEYDVHFPTMWVYTNGGGTATQLGRYTVSWEVVVDIPTGAGVNSAHFVAEDGDSLYSTSVAQGDPTTVPDEFRVVEKHTITGGTGRFEGASGSFTLVRLAEGTERRAGATSGSFEGTLVLAKGTGRGGHDGNR